MTGGSKAGVEESESGCDCMALGVGLEIVGISEYWIKIPSGLNDRLNLWKIFTKIRNIDPILRGDANEIRYQLDACMRRHDGVQWSWACSPLR